MAKKRGFTNVAEGLFSQPNIQAVQGVQEAHKVQEVHEEQEVQKVQEVQVVHKVQENNLNNTQGRKGHRLPRINMAFTSDNHLFIKRTSRQMGISATEYVNTLIEKERVK